MSDMKKDVFTLGAWTVTVTPPTVLRPYTLYSITRGKVELRRQISYPSIGDCQYAEWERERAKGRGPLFFPVKEIPAGQ